MRRGPQSPQFTNESQMKIKLFSIALLGLLPLAAGAQTADEIMKKVLDARGGADKIKAVLSQRVTGRVSFAPGMEGTFVVELKRPHKMHTEISVESQKIIRIYDGKGNGWVRFYLFDASSFLLLKWEGTRTIEGKDYPWESFFTDFREVQGLKYAFKIDQDSPGTDIKQTLTAEKIEINPQIDESRCAKPTSPAPPAAAVPQERGRPRSSD